jgi:threonine aldolase
MSPDFRSDTVTTPDDAMRAAMASARVGDDVYGDDPSVNALEERVAQMLGKSAGLFVTSGTQSNLIAILGHCRRGEEFLSGERYHSMKDEAGGAAVLGSVVPQALPVADDGSISEDAIRAAIKPDDIHMPISRLLCLENTVSGRVQSKRALDNLISVAHEHGLKTHLDGARLMNAVISSGVSASDYADGFDSVSLCISKGLGAPVGSVLVGDEDFIKTGRRLRKMLGGGMRQAGVIAAACDYALSHNIERLAEDHLRASGVARRLSEIDNAHVSLNEVETNMVYLQLPDDVAPDLKAFLADRGITISPPCPKFRLVMHKDITDAAIDNLVDGVADFMSRHRSQH